MHEPFREKKADTQAFWLAAVDINQIICTDFVLAAVLFSPGNIQIQSQQSAVVTLNRLTASHFFAYWFMHLNGRGENGKIKLQKYNFGRINFNFNIFCLVEQINKQAINQSKYDDSELVVSVTNFINSIVIDLFQLNYLINAMMIFNISSYKLNHFTESPNSVFSEFSIGNVLLKVQ